jgi:hypothetical protein
MPSFLDSRSRPLDERFGERPSVLDFIPQSQHGAVRDGSSSTDLTGWIQDGLDSLETAGGGILYLPWGVYPVADIDLPSNVTLVGDGPAKTILKRRATLPTGRGVLNIAGVNSGFEALAIDGQVTTPQVALYSSLSDPSSNALTENSSVRIHPGAKDISLRRFRIFHSGGYAVHIDARTGNVYRIEIDEPNLHDNRSWLFGAVGGSEIYGSWTGGILAQGDGLTNNYAVRGLKVTGGKFRRSTGNQIWSHVYGFGTLHSDFRIQGNSFEDIGRDGIMVGAVVGGDVSGNNFRRIGYVATDDSSPAVPRWINGQWAVGLDTAGLTRGVNYRGNTFINCYGAAMDLDGFAEGVVDGNTVIVSLSGEPEYAEDSLSSWAGNYCYGAQVSNTNDLAEAGVGVKVTGNRFRNCGLGAVRMYASRRGTVSGNTIEHPAGAAVAPIILGNVGAGDNKRSYGNTVTDNDVYYSPGSPVGVVQEDANGFNFTSGDVNRVYGNRLHGTNTFEFYKHSTSGSRTAQEYASAKSALTAESKNVMQREDGYWRGYWVEAGVTKTVFSLLDRVSLSGGGFGGPLWNVSVDAVGGVITTGARTTSAFDDAVLSSKMYADGFLAVAATTFAGAEANLLPDTVGLIRYNATAKIFEQSTAVSGGARVWAALAGSSLSGLTAGRIPYTTSASAIADSANLAWNNGSQVLTVTGVTGTASIVAATSFIQAAEGFYTPSGSSAAIGAPSGGVTALSLISVRNDGAAGLTLSRSSATARNYGLGIDSNGAFFVRDETGSAVRITMSTAGLVTIGSSVAIDQAGNISASATVAAAGVNVSGTAFNSLQVPSGGLFTGLGVTVDQAVYLKTFAGTPNNPGAGYGGWSHRSGSTYLYWNGSAWATVDLASTGGGVTSITGTTNQVVASASTGAVTLSLPQNIHTGAAPTFAGATLTSTVLLNVATNQGINISDGTYTGLWYASGLGGIVFGSTSAHPLIFFGGNADRGRITSAGNWLIATGTDDSSGAKLQVTGFIRTTVGFTTPSTATDAIQATAGGVTSKFLIGTTSFTLTGDTAANAGLSASGQGRIYFDSTSNKFRISEHGNAYVDLVGAASGVTSITGTANQVVASASTGAVTLSLPQNIHTAAVPQFGGVSVVAGSTNVGLTVTDGTISGLLYASSLGGIAVGSTSTGGGGHPVVFLTNNTDRGRITAAGNWLIATGTDDTSGAKLQVNGFVRAITGFSTPSTNSDAIQATAGGVTALSLISVRNDGGAQLTLSRTASTARTYQLGVDASGQLGLFDATAAAIRLTITTAGVFNFGTTVAINQSGAITASGVVQADGVNVVAGAPAYNSLQSNGGVYGALGATLDQALYLKTFAGSPNSPGGGYGALSHRSGSTYLYWNGSAWATVDLASTGGGVTSITGTTNQVVASASTGAVTLSLPQNIHTGAAPTFAGATLTSTVLLNVATNQGINISDGTYTGLWYASGLGGIVFGSTSAHPLIFFGGNADRGRITSAGNWLIATGTDDSSGAKLQVTGFIRTTVGFTTPSTATDAIQATAGGVTAKFLIGTTSLTLTGETSANAGLSSSGQGRIYFDSSTNKFRVSQHGGAYVDLVGSGGITSINSLSGPAITIAAGTAISVTPSGSTITVANTGVTALTGTSNQVSVSAATGSVTLSLPQNIHTGATPTFAALTATGVFQSQASGSDIGFQTTNFNFQVNGNGVVSSAGGFNVNGVNCINTSRQFVGYGVDVGSYGISGGGYNVSGGYVGQTWNVVGTFTINGTPYTTLVFRGGILVSAS